MSSTKVTPYYSLPTPYSKTEISTMTRSPVRSSRSIETKHLVSTQFLDQRRDLSTCTQTGVLGKTLPSSTVRSLYLGGTMWTTMSTWTLLAQAQSSSLAVLSRTLISVLLTPKVYQGSYSPNDPSYIFPTNKPPCVNQIYLQLSSFLDIGDGLTFIPFSFW